jgi:hypothetical protein
MKTSSGPESVRQHLNRSAIATILVGVGLLAVAWPSEAKIVYTPANITIEENSSYNLDLNNDGVTDFTISTSQTTRKCGPSQSGPYDSVAETPASGNGVAGSPPARLIEGNRIGRSKTFYGGTGTMAWVSYCDGQTHGGDNWISVKFGDITALAGYLGLMFQINGKTHYGWALLSVAKSGSEVVVTLNGYAYETTPAMAIRAGQTTDADESSALCPDPVNPENSDPGASGQQNQTQALSEGTFALGTQEVPLLRREESAGAAPENI